MTEPVNNKCTEHIKHNYNCKKCVGVKKPFLPIPNNEWLKPLMKEMGEKIVKGIYISVATDNDYDTQPLEDWLESAILSKLESIEQEAYKRGYIARGLDELRKYENEKG